MKNMHINYLGTHITKKMDQGGKSVWLCYPCHRRNQVFGVDELNAGKLTGADIPRKVRHLASDK